MKDTRVEIPSEELRDHTTLSIQEDNVPDQVWQIIDLIAEWLPRFVLKSRDYTAHNGKPMADRWGVPGQAMKIADKAEKVADAIVNKRDLENESVHEILEDLIGHCFLALKYLEEEDELEKKSMKEAKKAKDPFTKPLNEALKKIGQEPGLNQTDCF